MPRLFDCFFNDELSKIPLVKTTTNSEVPNDNFLESYMQYIMAVLNSSRVGQGLFQGNKVSDIEANALPLTYIKSSAAILLCMWNFGIFPSW